MVDSLKNCLRSSDDCPVCDDGDKEELNDYVGELLVAIGGMVEVLGLVSYVGSLYDVMKVLSCPKVKTEGGGQNYSSVLDSFSQLQGATDS